MSGGITVGQVESTRIEVEETGVTVKHIHAVHAYTNHYIKQSRPYFPDMKLPTYLYCPYLVLFSCLLCVASLVGSVFFPPAFFIACLVFFLIYFQHEWVSQKSLPVVLKQPVFDGQKTGNNFYEVTVTELKGMALENYRAGIGFVEVTQGKIEFQAFNYTAIKRMCRAKWYSRVMLVLFFVMSFYSLFFVVLVYS